MRALVVTVFKAKLESFVGNSVVRKQLFKRAYNKV